ncbi:chloride channel protein [Pedobacter sp. PACM 27299]|nr:chloride channel protein [Pedobacter sp. PACM 27299]
MPYIVRWLCLSSIIGVCIGSASAGFLQSLDWVTSYRENHLWLITMLPFGGLAIGLLYYYLGKDIEPGNNAIFPAFASAIIADLVTKLWNTHHTHYHINLVPDISVLHIIYAIIAGISFGICAASFSKIIHFTNSIFKSKITFPPLRPLVGGIIIALAVWAIGTTKYIGVGIPTIVASFDQQLPPYDFAVKMAFTVITLAAGFKGGEVTSLFFIGAALGNALSYFIPLPTGLLAGMGFVAVFAGATNTPLACMVMAMELFGSECGVYIAIACVVAYLFSGHNSIYGKQLVGEPKHSRFTNYQGKKINEL